MSTTKEHGRLAQLRNRISGAVMAAGGFVLATAGVASATVPADPAGDAATSAFADVQTMFLTVIVPAAVGLTVAILAIVMAIKWIRKTAKTA